MQLRNLATAVCLPSLLSTAILGCKPSECPSVLDAAGAVAGALDGSTSELEAQVAALESAVPADGHPELNWLKWTATELLKTRRRGDLPAAEQPPNAPDDHEDRKRAVGRFHDAYARAKDICV